MAYTRFKSKINDVEKFFSDNFKIFSALKSINIFHEVIFKITNLRNLKISLNYS